MNPGRAERHLGKARWRPMALGAVLVMLAAAMVGVAGPASATNWGSTDDCSYQSGSDGGTANFNCVSHGNNGTHVIRRYSLGDWAGIGGAVDNAVPLMDSQLEMNIYESTTDSLPDVKLADGNYGVNGVYGWTDCPGNNTGVGRHLGRADRRWCRGQNIRFNSNYRAMFPSTFTSLVMHETGHTLGLRHRDDGNGAMLTFSPYPTFYTGHDQNHVADFPPYD